MCPTLSCPCDRLKPSPCNPSKGDVVENGSMDDLNSDFEAGSSNHSYIYYIDTMLVKPLKIEIYK